MSHSTPTVVRASPAGAQIAVLLFPPWPVAYTQAAVEGHRLDGTPRRAPTYTADLPWGYMPPALFAQLWAITTTAPTEWYLPLPGQNSGGLIVYGWVRGYLVRPEGSMETWHRRAWQGMTFHLHGAEVV